MHVQSRWAAIPWSQAMATCMVMPVEVDAWPHVWTISEAEFVSAVA